MRAHGKESSMKTRIVRLTVAVTVALIGTTGRPVSAQDKPAAPTVSEGSMVTVRGWIDAVDKTNRTVTLKGPRGGTVTLDVKDPKKLEAMSVGDPVVAAFVEALAIKVKKVPGAAPSATVTEARVSSQPGETPSGAVGREVVVTTTITAVDRKEQTVTIKGPRGNTETIKVKDATNLSGVEAGDMAELTYTQALAVTLDRAGL
jgi:starvation-inducible outer membrane lipoprotein